jgi:hypothetical protein
MRQEAIMPLSIAYVIIIDKIGQDRIYILYIFLTVLFIIQSTREFGICCHATYFILSTDILTS